MPGAKKNFGDVIRAWLENQDVYALLKPVRKRFARNPYTVNNVMDLWECAKYNDNWRYIL